MREYDHFNRDNLQAIPLIPKRDEVYTIHNDLEKESVLKKITSLKDQPHGEITLVMDKVDVPYIKKIYKMIGNKLRIAPTFAQEEVVFGSVGYPTYSYYQIMKSEKAIDLYVKTVMDYYDKDGMIKSLSPLEKFMAAYIMVTKFAPYKLEKYADTSIYQHTSRSVYEFIDKKDRHIVCVGYVNLLKMFLDRMGISSTLNISTFIKGEKYGHERLLIHLVDPKYEEDSIFISDPTADEKGIIKTRFDNMLLSCEQESSLISRGRSKINLNEKIGSSENIIWKIDGNFDVNDPDKLFHNPISTDKIIYAYLAVTRFLDKNMKMVNNPDEYSDLEFFDAAYKLGLSTNVKSRDYNNVYNEGLNLSFKELYTNYPYVADDFAANLNMMITKKYRYDGLIFYSHVINDKNKNFDKAIFTLYPINFDLVKKLKKHNWPMDFENGRYVPIIYQFNDKPIKDQMADIDSAFNNFI